MGWSGYGRRIDHAMLTEVLNQLSPTPQCFNCGPTLMVENVVNILTDMGLPADTIRTERFGPS
jgi:ferredoxin-NADP reductase